MTQHIMKNDDDEELKNIVGAMINLAYYDNVELIFEQIEIILKSAIEACNANNMGGEALDHDCLFKAIIRALEMRNTTGKIEPFMKGSIKKNQGEKMLDIRLDFIKNISPEYIHLMTGIRKDFIGIDQDLSSFESLGCHEDNYNAAMRAVSIARTHLETACQYAIKALCICGEIKSDNK